MPSWEETEDIGYDIPNTGRYEWIPRASGLVTADNAVGVIRITRRWKKYEESNTEKISYYTRIFAGSFLCLYLVSRGINIWKERGLFHQTFNLRGKKHWVSYPSFPIKFS